MPAQALMTMRPLHPARTTIPAVDEWDSRAASMRLSKHRTTVNVVFHVGLFG